MKAKYIRRGFQIFFFILLVYGGFLVYTYFGVEKPVIARGSEGEVNLVDATLPVRSCRYIEPKPTLLEACSVRYLLDRPLYLGPVAPILFYVLLIIGLCFVFGRFMCGWFCPFGFLGEMLDSGRKTARIRRVTLSKKISGGLRIWKYSFLLFLVFASLAVITPFAYGAFMDKDFYAVACQVCPVKLILPIFVGKMPLIPPFMTFITSVFSIISLLFLGVFLTGVIVSRAWCRVCPNGAFLSLFNRGSLVVKEKDVRKCTKCGVCKRVCPFSNEHVFEEKDNKKINSPSCIFCCTCIDKCPEDECLKLKIGGVKLFSSKFKK